VVLRESANHSCDKKKCARPQILFETNVMGSHGKVWCFW
jgi:hypothetical protein